jgi:hypothetical protein
MQRARKGTRRRIKCRTSSIRGRRKKSEENLDENKNSKKWKENKLDNVPEGTALKKRRKGGRQG